EFALSLEFAACCGLVRTRIRVQMSRRICSGQLKHGESLSSLGQRGLASSVVAPQVVDSRRSHQCWTTRQAQMAQVAAQRLLRLPMRRGLGVQRTTVVSTALYVSWFDGPATEK